VLKSRDSIAAAWISFGLYWIGIGFLLTILAIQIRGILCAAGCVAVGTTKVVRVIGGSPRPPLPRSDISTS
jgi:hypothetical protein